MKYLLKTLVRKFIESLKAQFIGRLLYRDLIIVKAVAKSPDSKCVFFGSQISVDLNSPDLVCDSHVSGFPKEIEEKIGTHTPIRKYYKVFENCLILGGISPIVLDSNDKPIWNSVAYQFFNFSKNYTPVKWFLQKKTFSEINEIQSVFLLYTIWHSN